MKDFFAQDPARADTLSVQFGNIFFDYSKNIATKETIDLLLQLAEECNIQGEANAMFSGAKINTTEKRSVLHTALRRDLSKPLEVEGVDVSLQVKDALEKMLGFADRVHSGEFRSYTGEKFTDVVNIGIGGSDLGPVMVSRALKHYSMGLRCHFVSNIDGTHLAETLK